MYSFITVRRMLRKIYLHIEKDREQIKLEKE